MEALALGVQIKNEGPRLKDVGSLLIILFSFITPIGILIGIVFNETSILIEVIVSSLAAGSFLYISCSEIIIEEFG